MNYCVKDYANGEILKEARNTLKKRISNDFNYDKGDKSNEHFSLCN